MEVCIKEQVQPRMAVTALIHAAVGLTELGERIPLAEAIEKVQEQLNWYRLAFAGQENFYDQTNRKERSH